MRWPRSARNLNSGRLYTADEDLAGNDRVMLISHEFWQARLGGRSDVLGMTLTVNQQPRTVIGDHAAGLHD